ncbi:hypothetical protein F4815DRAFT_198810 [Daldinia loculata]|nr:hypothetical protein F4815DRAFT_198810 [Daldinia loculata]
MNLIHWTHTIRAPTPFGLVSRTRTQLYPNRVSPYHFRHQPSVRSFHLAPTAATVIQTAQDTLLAIHSLTHTPWFLTIPLAAVGVSLAFRLPFNVYIHKINQRRARFTPVLMGWTARISRDVKREGIPSSRESKELLARHKKLASRIHRTVGLQDWKLYSSVLGLPFWLIGIESVRRICGGPRGIIGQLFLGRTEDVAASNTQGNVEIPVDPSVTATTAEHVKNLPDLSITLEGCLWFPDLSAPDPYHILPFALSALLVWNMLPKSKAGLQQLAGLNSGDKVVVETPAMMRQRRLRRVLIVLSALIGPMTADLPAALHLYWLSTSATHTVTSKALSKFMPIDTNIVQRCVGYEADVIRPKRIEKAVKATN